MVIIDDLKALNGEQRSAFIASFLGWTLDAFDFFILTFVAKDIAGDFNVKVSAVLAAVMLTLVARPFGALFFGWLADKYGRRPVLMADILLYSALELASAFAPNLVSLLVLRTLFGFAMGGEWGIGASLALESIPARSRGVVSGILQEGYACGQLLGALVFGLVFPHLTGLIPGVANWRLMFVIGVLPALLVFYVRRHVKESPAWEKMRRDGVKTKRGEGVFTSLATHWPVVLYAVLLMTAFNFFSHGTQDTYATFLRVQHNFSPTMVMTLTVIMNVGAIIGGLTFGALSQRIGRRYAIIIAALLALPIIPLWAFSATPLLLGLGGFLLQIAVQGAWGVVPVHLNELSPPSARGTFPGTAYQLGNLLAAGNAVMQGKIAESHHNNYGLALALVAGITAVVLAVLTFFGPEAKGVSFDAEPQPSGDLVKAGRA
jgi:SHS family lactate transporter-like MFS transporter